MGVKLSLILPILGSGMKSCVISYLIELHSRGQYSEHISNGLLLTNCSRNLRVQSSWVRLALLLMHAVLITLNRGGREREKKMFKLINSFYIRKLRRRGDAHHQATGVCNCIRLFVCTSCFDTFESSRLVCKLCCGSLCIRWVFCFGRIATRFCSIC